MGGNDLIPAEHNRWNSVLTGASMWPCRLHSVLGSSAPIHQIWGNYIIQQSLKPFSALTSSPCSASFSKSLCPAFPQCPVLAALVRLICLTSKIEYFKSLRPRYLWAVVGTHLDATLDGSVVFRKPAAGLLFVPGIWKTNTAAQCIHSQPPLYVEVCLLPQCQP